MVKQEIPEQLAQLAEAELLAVEVVEQQAAQVVRVVLDCIAVAEVAVVKQDKTAALAVPAHLLVVLE